MIDADPGLFHAITTARIHVFGAAGTGVTTLAKALADHLGHRYLDTDDYLWAPTEPPYQEKHPVDVRVELLLRATQASAWVLGGSLITWGDPVIPRFTSAVFVTLDQEERLRRLRIRERQRFGPRIEPGGDMYHTHLDLLAWAALYESNRLDVRTRALHERWITTLPCPIVRVPGAMPTDRQLHLVLRRDLPG